MVIGVMCRLGSAFRPAAILLPISLLSCCTSATSIALVLALPPNREPKKAAITIGSARLMTSARRSDRNRMRSLRTRARKGINAAVMSVAQAASGQGQEDVFQAGACGGEVQRPAAGLLQPAHHGQGVGRLRQADVERRAIGGELVAIQ
jgi:hypothetical protein